MTAEPETEPKTEPENARVTALLDTPRRCAATAAGLVAFGAGLIVLALVLGWHSGGEPVRTGPGSKPSNVMLLGQLLLAVAVISGFAISCGALARRLGQPRVVGEMVAGLLIGPSLLGTLAPDVFHAILPSAVLPFVSLAAQVGLVIFMFSVGRTFEPGVLTGQRNALGAASAAIMLVPFAFGLLAAIPLRSAFGTQAVSSLQFALFIGTALSVTAFPVLARLVHDAGLDHTRLGRLAMLCAAVTDVLAWCALAVVIAISRAQDPLLATQSLLLAVALCLFCRYVLRPGLRHPVTTAVLAKCPAVLRVLVLLGLITGLAVATAAIGVHEIFGGFLAGLVIRNDIPAFRELTPRVEAANSALLVPLFFASIGLVTNVGLALDSPGVLAAGALVFVAAIAGKIGTATVVGLAGGLGRRTSLGLGMLMNARGITEIVVLSSGLSLGIINGEAFTVMVLMALLTTIAVAPALRILGIRRHAPAKPADSSNPDVTEAAG
jgi:Kef-type K+ transport system membrane component KefB